MIKIGPKYVKLKTDLQLACQRLKILQAKKMELSQKLQKEIANHLNKDDFYLLSKVFKKDDMDCNLLREQMHFFDLDSKHVYSLPDGLNEEHRFLPNTEIPIRRTNSLDDISRFYRYFHLLQTNKGMLFTWKHYLKILRDQLSNFETLTILNKAMLTFVSNISLDKTGYFTPETGYSSSQESTTPSTTIPKKLFFDNDLERTSTAEDGSSVMSGSNTGAILKSRMLKKICLEMRSLAQNISKFVDVIGHLPENCTECGVAMDIQKYKKQCQHIIEGVGDTVDCSREHKIKGKVIS
ncbi:hypothetical protein AVEN_145528-1 [Araneus ventricosus]|uniref:Uncharacterized protein n=1 Tax=Araneus ventricosus TaxID=182803 RepID=A0A4Y2SGA9_ARAVE|nr:hypothetical protein AVEN_145528-1 [Araneus ventricosus]